MADGYNRLTDGSVISEAEWDENIDSLELEGYQVHGRGVVTGLVLSIGSGLVVNISAGVANILRAKSISSTSYTMPPSVTRYLWIDLAGAVTPSATSAYPGGQVVCLGKAISGVSTISSVSEDNRDEIARMVSRGSYEIGKSNVYVDYLNGYVGVNKTPTQAFDVSGAAKFDAIVQGPALVHVPNQQTLSADLTLTSTSARVQELTPSGADRKVILPSGTPTLGDRFEIWNKAASSGYNLLVRDAADATTLYTMKPGGGIEIYAEIDSLGVVKWPVPIQGVPIS